MTTAILDPDGTTFTMKRGSWTATIRVAELQSWLDFYRKQVLLFPEQSAGYADDIGALETLARELGRQ